MKVSEAVVIINSLKKLSLLNIKSTRNPAITLKQELEIMEAAIESKSDDENLNPGLSKSFERMKHSYEYLESL